ncbi:hypothetical protein O4328_29225 [Rhodococcus opacus]|uniref:Uncharacterized protein n=1 Tax=Rhodococcus opacus TaxID=37919 RepID=A0AAX3YQZ5_RHOOP|nr:hypothetical protein [Rhodococcus opacus]MCZ4587725.1 hypothetical protein [Rhodococcus opacus]WLF51280.1 hypothetical protein Q5707_38615 [Rhodococcus opacus]
MDRAETIAALRRHIAAVPARGSANPAATADPTTQHKVEALPVPDHLRPVVPRGGITRGTVVEMTGARGPVLSLVAAVTAAGGFAALVGMPSAGLLAALEQGANLERLAVINDPGDDPLAEVSVLADGIDLIVWDPGQARLAPSAERVAAGRLRSKKSTLILTDTGWQRPDLRLRSEIVGYGGLEPGSFGRLQSIDMRVQAYGRGVAPTETTFRITGTSGTITTRTLDAGLTTSRLRAVGH